jgi:hypothetical protein
MIWEFLGILILSFLTELVRVGYTRHATAAPSRLTGP